MGVDGVDEGFAAWMAASQPRLLRTAYLLCGDAHTAEDLTQTTLAKMFLAWARLRRRDDLDAYARRVLVNEHVSLWRRAWRQRELTVEVLPEHPVAAPVYDGVELTLWRRLLDLPRRQRAVVVLRYYEQLSVGEVAAVLGVSVADVVRRAERVRHQRRATATGVVAGVLAVLVVVSLGRTVGHRNAVPVAPHTDDTTVTVRSLADVPLGLGPGIGWGDDTRFHLADGRVLDVPGGRPYDFWLPFPGGVFVGTQPGTLDRYDDEGRLTDRYGPGTVAVSGNGRRIAWSSDDVVRVARPDGGNMRVTTVPDATSLAGFLPGGALVVNASHPVVVRDGGVVRLRGLATAEATSDVLGLVAGDRPGAERSGVVDSTGRVLWTTRLRLGGFAPDGRHVVGVDRSSNPRFVSVLDSRTGRVVRTLRLARSAHLLADLGTWEDASRVLFVAVDTAHRHDVVLRLDYLRDGRAAVDRALPLRPLAEGPYTFPVTP